MKQETTTTSTVSDKEDEGFKQGYKDGYEAGRIKMWQKISDGRLYYAVFGVCIGGILGYFSKLGIIPFLCLIGIFIFGDWVAETHLEHKKILEDIK